MWSGEAKSEVIAGLTPFGYGLGMKEIAILPRICAPIWPETRDF